MRKVVRDFKSYEIFSLIKIPPTVPFIIRCDGRNFRDLCEQVGFRKPFDEKFARIMVEAAKSIFSVGFNPALVYIQSDEISYLFTKDIIFNRRVEKLISIIPSTISSKFSIEIFKRFNLELNVSFDARVIVLTMEDIIDYFIWRQMEAWRNHINSYAFYALIRKGYSRSNAAKKLLKMKSDQLHELVFKELNINLAKTPAWQRRGIVLYWKCIVKESINPLSGEIVKTIRRVLTEDWNPPLFSSPEGRNYIENAILMAEKEISEAFN